MALFDFPPRFTFDLQATFEKLLGFGGFTGVEVVFSFTTDHTIFAVPSASETDYFNKGTFST